MNKLAIPSILVATVLVLGTVSIMPNAFAAKASVTGSGTFRAGSVVDACPPIDFNLDVTGKSNAGGAGAATGTYKEACTGPISQTDLTSIDTIVSIDDTTAHVRGKVSLADQGVANCRDQNGNPVTHYIVNLEVTEGTSTSTPPGTIHVFAEFPPGVTSITCEAQGEDTLPGSGAIIIFFDPGVQTITAGSITVDDGIA